MISDVPFYSNSADNTHCYQAVIRMILAYYFPEEEYSWEQLDEITGKQSGKWSWPIRGLLYLAERGLDVEYIGTFDYNKFTVDGEQYLRERFGKEVAEAQITNSDIPQEMKVAEAMAEKVNQVKKIPTIDMLRKLGSEGKVLILNVNYRALYAKKGFIGHFVLASQIGDDKVVVHDPGLPGKPAEEIPLDRFLAAWLYSGPEKADVVMIDSKN